MYSKSICIPKLHITNTVSKEYLTRTLECIKIYLILNVFGSYSLIIIIIYIATSEHSLSIYDEDNVYLRTNRNCSTGLKDYT